MNNNDIRIIQENHLPTLTRDEDGKPIDLPITLAYALRKNRRVVKVAYNDYDGPRMTLVEKFADREEDGSIKMLGNEGDERRPAVFSDENRALYAAENIKLLLLEVDVPIHYIQESDLLSLKNASQDLLDALEWMIAPPPKPKVE
jgi:hypothetical protein